MSRPSLEKKDQNDAEIEEILESDSDDDEDFSATFPSLSQNSADSRTRMTPDVVDYQPSSSPASKVSPDEKKKDGCPVASATNGNDDDETSAEKVAEAAAAAAAALEERAQKRANSALLCVLNDVKDPNLLRWYRQKTIYFPVCIQENHDEAKFLNVNLNSRNDILFCTLGLLKKKQFGAASASSLTPYYHDNVNDKTQWNAQLMAEYKKRLATHKELKDNVELNVRIEELVLQRMLDKVLHQASSTSSSKDTTTLSTDKQDTANVPLEEDGQDLSEEEEEDDHQEAENDEEEGEESTASAASLPAPADSSSSSSSQQLSMPTIKLPTGKIALRPGDVLDYHNPVMVACDRSKMHGTIIKVFDRNVAGGSAVLMNDNKILARDEYVSLVERVLRGKRYRVKNPKRRQLSDFILSSKNNSKGSLEGVPRLADALDQFCETAVEEAWAATGQQEESESGADKEHDDDAQEQAKPSALPHPSLNEVAMEDTGKKSAEARTDAKMYVGEPADSKRGNPETKVSERPIRTGKAGKTLVNQIMSLSDGKSTSKEIYPKASRKRKAPLVHSKAGANVKLNDQKPSAKKDHNPSVKKLVWQGDLELRLQGRLTNIRRQSDKVAMIEKWLDVAIRVRRVLTSRHGEDHLSEEGLMQGFEEEFDFPAKSLCDYLTGDPQNFLNDSKVTELTKKWGTFLAKNTEETKD